MSNWNCNSLSCGRSNRWNNCHNCGCQNWGCNNCGCVASDGTPACNPCAPWGSTACDLSCSCRRCSGGCNSWNCDNDCAGTASCENSCSACGNTPCTCGQCSACCTGNLNGGCLVPRIISTGRTFQRRITQTLCIDDLPDYADSPLTLISVTVSGQSTWEQISECRQTLLRVMVPVSVQVRDCSGRCLTGHATVTLTIPLCMRCPAQDFWRGQLFVAPCIRLAASVAENDDGCFDATLEVQADVYLLRMQVVNC